MKPCILIFLGNYLPGFKSGGPARTIANMVERLGDEFQFKIITRDRDLGDAVPYEGIKAGAWNEVSKASVYYMPNGRISFSKMKRLVNEARPDLIYFNSFFSPVATIKPLLLRYFGLMPRVPFIIAPRGEFSISAVNSKRLKKSVFTKMAKMLGYYDNMAWQASSEYEAKDISRVFGERVKVVVAPDLSQSSYSIDNGGSLPKKICNSIKIVFLSRISPVKNLLMALGVLKNVKGDVRFDIYGPIEDRAYWSECSSAIDKLPANVKARHCGTVAHDKVVNVMKDYHLFFCPTKGENFGHAILEAMIAGCPVLISDQTPWRGLQKEGVGWDISLEDHAAFAKALDLCIKMGDEQYSAMQRKTREYAFNVTKDEGVVEQNRRLFREALNI